MLTIRLQRTGTKNKASFRIVLADKEKAAGKKFQEVLGHYNPRSKQFAIKDDARLKYWIGQHIELSPTVHNLLVEKKLVDAKKIKAWKPKKKEAEAVAEAPKAPASTAEAPKSETPVAEAPKTEEAPATPQTTA